MSRKIVLVLLFLFHLSLSSHDNKNKFLDAFYKIEKGDTNFFRQISHAKDAGSNFAFYLCKAKLQESSSSKIGAFALYKKSIDIANTPKDKAIANVKLGIYCHHNDLLIQALQYFNAAELLYQFDVSEQEYMELNKFIGIIHSHLGSKKKSIERFMKVYELANITHNKKQVGHAANNIGINYIDLHEFEKAEEYLNMSLTIRKELGDELLLGQSYNNFGTLYYEKGDYENALEFFKKGYQLRQNFPENQGAITESEINIGKTYLKLGNRKEAEEILRFAYEKGNAIKHMKFLSLSSFLLKDIYYDRGDYRNAFEMQKQYQLAQDSLFGYEKRDEVNRLTLESEFKGRMVSDSLALLRQESEIREKESKNQQNKLLLTGLAVVLLLVIFIVINLFRQNKREQAKNELISRQAEELAEQHKEIKDSINYAQNLQATLLASDDVMQKELKEYFVLYLPKDVISGDFYWMERTNEGLLLAVADCTGHGVPGAIVSVVGINALSRCINEFKLRQPAQLLDKLSLLVADSFSDESRQLNDGMDISLLFIPGSDTQMSRALWSGAHNPLWIIRNNQLIEYKATRRPVGAFVKDMPFKEENITFEKGDMIYLFTDGYGDQFGGPQSKKFKQSKLKDLLLNIHNKVCEEQHEILRTHFSEWKGSLEQIDDVTVMGFRV